MIEGEKVIRLIECCDEELRRDVTHASGNKSMIGKTEEFVLEAIQHLDVHSENILVARTNLGKMMQDRDEPVCTFHTRLMGVVNTCAYNKKCTKEGCTEIIDFSVIYT